MPPTTTASACRGGDPHQEITGPPHLPCDSTALQNFKANPPESNKDLQIRQTKECLKTKTAECAMLRAELVFKKEEVQKEKCQHREARNKLRELEMKLQGLTTHTNLLLGTQEQAMEKEVTVKTLKQSYQNTRDEIDELRMVAKEQNETVEEYRCKFIQAQQLVEEQERQIKLLELDNRRISDLITLEVNRVKLIFTEKLEELRALPDLLLGTQQKLKAAQQTQAIAEYNAEQLGRELSCARDKINSMTASLNKPPEKTEPKQNNEKQMQNLQLKITELTENNASLKAQVERLKNKVIQMEEAVQAIEKRLKEKVHECAILGGDLDSSKTEAKLAFQRAEERKEAIRKCLQMTIGELELQLAGSKAQVATAIRQREEAQARIKEELQRLNQNCEQSQQRLKSLEEHADMLSEPLTVPAGGELECKCKSQFKNP